MKKLGAKRETTHTVISDIKEIITASKHDEFTHFVFRGQSSTKYQLVPSIARKQSFLDNENNIIAMAAYRKPDIFPIHSSPIELLAKLQHYGIPTRLLDVTRNALVALYFACGDEATKSEDGVIYIFKYDIRKSCNINILEGAYQNNKWCSGMVDKTLQKMDRPIIIEAPADLLRQNVQQGMYMLFLNDFPPMEETPEYSNSISPVLDTDSSIIGKIIISSRGKKGIKRELESLGISESTLFPENIDLFSAEMKKQFEV